MEIYDKLPVPKHDNLRNPPSIRALFGSHDFQASVEDPGVASTLHDACAIRKSQACDLYIDPFCWGGFK